MKKILCPFAILFALAYLPYFTNGQAYLQFSKYAGGSEDEFAEIMQVVNGETYTISATYSADYPVTNGSTYSGRMDMVLTKYGINGNVIFATYLGGKGGDMPVNMKIINGEAFILASTDSSGFPVTNGSSFRGLRDIVITKINATGSIGFCTYIGGSSYDDVQEGGLQINGNNIFLAGTTGSEDFPVSDGGTFHGGIKDVFAARINSLDGNIIQCKFLGGSDYESCNSALLDNNDFYITGTSRSLNLPVTVGNNVFGSPQPYHVFVFKLNAYDLTTQYCRLLAGSGFDGVNIMKTGNGKLHLSGYTTSVNYPVTNGTTSYNSGVIYDQNSYDCYYTRLNSDGNIDFSTYIGTAYYDYPLDMIVAGNETYIHSFSVDNGSGHNHTKQLHFYKISNSAISYGKNFDIGVGGNAFTDGGNNMEVVNGELFFTGNTNNASYPVTTSNQFYSEGTSFLTKLDAAGNLAFSTFLGKASELSFNDNSSLLYPRLKVFNNRIYLFNRARSASYPATDSNTFRGNLDNLLLIFRPDGSTEHSGYFGGSEYDDALAMDVDISGVYLFGNTYSQDYPVTENVLYHGNTESFLTKISFCPPSYSLSNDSLSPKNQTTCMYGLAHKITGRQITIDASTLPLIYRNGISSGQTNIIATYKWQKASALNGPYTDIANATTKDYTPIIGAEPQYYRRLAFAAKGCDSTLLHTSDTAGVLLSGYTAPLVNAGGNLITCPGSSITLGGSPTASGGNPPYVSYQWDRGAAGTANPTVSPGENTIYTLTVTDNAGCKQIAQSVVFVYRANAGIDKGNCAGSPVLIGGEPIAGATGVSYNWQPAAGLSSSTVAQPFANPAATSNYILTLTVPKTGGSTCISKDSMIVTPVPGPLTANFAGPDKVLCLADTLVIGTAAEPGFNYVWSPGFYLTNNTTATTNYYPGNLFMPVPNPAIYNFTAQKNGCSFFDKVEVATIESNAGGTKCGPGTIGTPDRTHAINETYQWTLVSGPGHFTGPTNLPMVPVSASVGGNSVYGLTVTYRGHSCYSEVTVKENCSPCPLVIDVTARYKCPSYGVNLGDVSLTANHSIVGNIIYRWSPQVGLTSYNTQTVKLTDNVLRLYTVTVINALDTNKKCVGVIMVNDPAASIPVFDAPDKVVCSNVPVSIGLPPVAGYTYAWSGYGLNNNSISNPTVQLNGPQSYYVTVTESTGCRIKDTVEVVVESVHADAGPDWTICSNGVVKPGTAGNSNTSYLWEPQLSPWQNGTDQHSAQPEVLLATNVTFTVTASTPNGCTASDQVNVVVNNSPTIPDMSNLTLCSGYRATLGRPALPGVTYQWMPATGLDNPNVAQPVASPDTTTTYTLTANFPGNCALPAIKQVTVTVIGTSFHMADIRYCPGDGPVSLGAGAPSDMQLYSWSPAQWIVNTTVANASTINPPPHDSTAFTLLVTDQNGCSYRDTILLIPVITAPIAGVDKTVCLNSSTQIGSASNAAGAGISYSWSPAVQLDNVNSNNPLFSGNTSGVYTYILTKTENSCILKDTVLVTVKDSILRAIGSHVVCQNSCVHIGVDPAPGMQYQWSPATGLSNAFISNPLACVGTTTVSYSLTATDAGGCTGQQNVVVGVNAAPAPQVSIPSVAACMGDTSVHFNPVISPSGSYYYLWSPNDGSLSNINIANPAVFIAGIGSMQYNLQVTNAVSGCTSNALGNVTGNICNPLSSVGDYMWFDINKDGMQDANELGVSGMQINLYTLAGVNVSNSITDANGFYSFNNVQPDTGYYVIFNVPAGYKFTLQNIGGFAVANNSKADAASGRTPAFAIPQGAAILNIDAGIVPSGTTPVSLLSFTGTLYSQDVLLNWQTTAEFNNHYFDVERSSDGVNFISIGRVNGNGTTSLPHNYSFIDAHPLNGINYYRLQQVDFDGHITYSKIVLIKISKGPAVTSLYNNQSNSIQINFEKQQSKTVISLIAANGQLITTGTVTNNNQYTLNLPLLAAGVYMLQLVSREGIDTKKIVIGN